MGEGKENPGGRNCFPSSNEIFKTVLNIRKLNTPTILNPCLAFGVWNCVSRLAKGKAKKPQQILNCQQHLWALATQHQCPAPQVLPSVLGGAQMAAASSRQNCLRRYLLIYRTPKKITLGIASRLSLPYAPGHMMMQAHVYIKGYDLVL